MTTTQSLHGVYTGRAFNTSFRGQVLGGRFRDCDFTDADLTDADLSGDFVDCTFNTTWRKAARTGTFTDCREE